MDYVANNGIFVYTLKTKWAMICEFFFIEVMLHLLYLEKNRQIIGMLAWQKSLLFTHRSETLVKKE